MIATLKGLISEKIGDSIILEAAGVGYELTVVAEDWGNSKLGSEARYYIYEQIREDTHNLYGFREVSAKQLFAQLLGISGVGPKLAMQILSAAGESRLRQAITSGDPDLLRGISGVGPKTAQRVIVELRGKVEEGTAGLAPVTDSTYQALVALGYTPSQATAAVAQVPLDVTDEQARLKLALQGTKPH
ncbi:MAG TPA: Holliday junction branch migration protein RuvA [Candidatus Saccharimonadia bacterium]|nr:Holliday junction branch migration protein RuvA [Candidatus Saccharimonadia bacterium]